MLQATQKPCENFVFFFLNPDKTEENFMYEIIDLSDFAYHFL